MTTINKSVDMKKRKDSHEKARAIVASAIVDDLGAEELTVFKSHNDFIYRNMRISVRGATERYGIWSYRNETSDDTDIFICVGTSCDNVDHICMLPYYYMPYDSHIDILGIKQYTYKPLMAQNTDEMKNILNSIIDEWSDIETYCNRRR